MTQFIEKNLIRNILLNPGPATTSTRVKQAQLVSDICPREEEFGDLIQGIKGKLQSLVNSDHKVVLLGGSGTAAVEACLSSCTSEKGKVLILENGAYGTRMKAICDRLNIKADLISFSKKEKIKIDQVKTYLKENKDQYEVLAVIHHETTSGVLNPLKEISDLAIEHNLSLLVDAMSSFAGIPIDLKELKVDYLISSSNKCIQGMAGVGIVFVSPNEVERIKDHPKKSFYLDLLSNLNSQDVKGQFLFTPPVQVLYSLDEACDELKEEGGVKARSQRYKGLYNLMLKGMKELGFNLFTKEEDNSGILTTFLAPNISNYSFEGMHNFFLNKGITIYPGKVVEEDTFRISNIGDLKESDILQFLYEMKEYLDAIRD